MKDKLRVVDFETAKELKELGFNLTCHAFYNPTYSDNIEYPEDGGEFINWNIEDHLYSAPEQSLVVKWFRDVHKLSIESGWVGKGYKPVIIDVSKPGFLIVAGGDNFKLQYSNFEDAELEGIKEGIKYLKNGTNLQK